MFVKLSYYAHSAQDKLGNLLPYEHWQTLQAIQAMLVKWWRSLLGYSVRRKLPARRESFAI